MLWRATQSYPTGVFDFYPLYYGAKAWLHTGNAYALGDVVPASHQGYQLLIIGNIYPLPAVFLALPFSFLPPQAAGILLLGLLTAGLVVGLRLINGTPWYLLYLPMLEGLRIEQYTAVILVLQLFALWALRERRWWVLALCCAFIASKPNQGLIFVLAMLLLARHWRQQLVVGAAVWGGSLLLDPNWIVEWIPRLYNHHQVLHQTIFWPLALLSIPLFLVRDVVGGAVVLQFMMLPYPGVYAASAVPLSVLDDRRAKYLAPASFAWMFVAIPLGQAWATALTLIAPVVVLAVLRWREGVRSRDYSAPPAPRTGTSAVASS